MVHGLAERLTVGRLAHERDRVYERGVPVDLAVGEVRVEVLDRAPQASERGEALDRLGRVVGSLGRFDRLGRGHGSAVYDVE